MARWWKHRCALLNRDPRKARFETMNVAQRIILGTRGSELARAQTLLVESALRAACPGIEVGVRIIVTSGDEKSGPDPVDRRAGRKGVFTSEIERALLSGQIDIAVHSAKDLPSETTAGVEVSAALVRADVEDVLVGKAADDLASLPAGATIATGSVRRQRQLHWVRPDFNLVDLRGNVPTRLRKLTTQPWDAVVLARAGLSRLGMDSLNREFSFEGQTLRTAVLSRDEFLPAGGQGIVALQVRKDDAETWRATKAVNHEETFLCLRAEREFLRLLQGDCGTPVGVLATGDETSFAMRAQIFDEQSAEPRVACLHRKIVGHYQPETAAAELLELINGR